jgi:hypothetical protein
MQKRSQLAARPPLVAFGPQNGAVALSLGLMWMSRGMDRRSCCVVLSA